MGTKSLKRMKKDSGNAMSVVKQNLTKTVFHMFVISATKHLTKDMVFETIFARTTQIHNICEKTEMNIVHCSLNKGYYYHKQRNHNAFLFLKREFIFLFSMSSICYKF